MYVYEYVYILHTYTHTAQQDNEWDCGVFVLEYMEKICVDHPEPSLDEILTRDNPETFIER